MWIHSPEDLSNGACFGPIKRIFSPPPPPPPPAPIRPEPIPQPAAAPTEQNRSEDLAEAANREKERNRTQRGRGATILSRQRKGALAEEAGVATKKLLGGG